MNDQELLCCIFCGRTKLEVAVLVHDGQNGICNECIDLAKKRATEYLSKQYVPSAETNTTVTPFRFGKRKMAT